MISHWLRRAFRAPSHRDRGFFQCGDEHKGGSGGKGRERGGRGERREESDQKGKDSRSKMRLQSETKGWDESPTSVKICQHVRGKNNSGLQRFLMSLVARLNTTRTLCHPIDLCAASAPTQGLSFSMQSSCICIQRKSALFIFLLL